MDNPILKALRAALEDVGTNRGLVIALGGVFLLLGLVGLALAATIRQTAPVGTRSRGRFLMIVSVLLTSIGGLAILGLGIIIPLGILREKATQVPIQLLQQRFRLELT